MKKKIPAFLLDKGQLIGNVVVTVFFAVVFLNIYAPISTTAWFELDRSIYFFFTLGFISLATLILVISRVIMYRSRLSLNFTWPGYCMWIALEVFLIACFYAFVTAFYVENDPAYFAMIFPKGLLYVSIIMLVPDVIMFLYGTTNDKMKTLRLLKYDDVVSDEPGVAKGVDIIHLTDNNGNLKLSVRLNNLLYIESQDNYVKVYYSHDNNLKSYMLRCKIKTVEESFAGSSLVRCHRSYIVNTDKIRVVRKEKEGIFIDLDYNDTQPIPVSKGYSAALTGYFTKN